MIVMGIDPGGTTGVSIIAAEEELSEQIYWHQFPDADTFYLDLETLIRTFNPDVVVIEQFDKRPGIVNPDYTPKYVCRDIENHVIPNHPEVEFVFQIPALAMNMVRTARKGGVDGLKRFGWYRVSNVHANDATRHAVAYLVHTAKHMPTILRGWPKPERAY